MYFKGLFSLLSLLALTLLVVSPVLAQTDDPGTISGDGNNNPTNCENAQEVATFEGSTGENFITDPFQITGGQFRVSFESGGTGFAFVSIEILDENGDLVDDFVAGDEEAQTSLLVNAGPGDFVLDVTADTDDPFTVTVEDCGGAADDGGNNNGGDDGDDNNDGIIDDTIPNKPLPNTGGIPLIVAGGVLLLSVGGIVAAWRSKEQ